MTKADVDFTFPFPVRPELLSTWPGLTGTTTTNVYYGGTSLEYVGRHR